MARIDDEAMNQGSIQPQTQKSLGSSRREFAKSLAALAAIPLLGNGKARGSTEEALPVTANPGTMASAAEQTQPQEKPLPEAEALAEVAKVQYGKYLSDDQMAEIKRSISGRFRAAETMKKTKLANGDEPAFIFSANPQ